MILCDLCGQAKECQQKQIDGKDGQSTLTDEADSFGDRSSKLRSPLGAASEYGGQK
jgi:hypothetical protein